VDACLAGNSPEELGVLDAGSRRAAEHLSAMASELDRINARLDAAFARMKSDEAVVPSLWWFEIRNILVVNERRKRITEADSSLFLRDLAGLRVRIDREPEEMWS